MRIRAILGFVLIAGLAGCADEPTAPFQQARPAMSVTTTSELVTLYFGDFPLDGSTKVLPGYWDLTAGQLSLKYVADLSEAPNVAYNNDWSRMAVVGLFSPGNAGAQLVAFNYNWDFPGSGEFPMYPDNDGSLDNDDKLNLQRFPNPGSYDESVYDVHCATNDKVSAFGSGSNYGVWFDRDGVDQWQATYWGMVDGGTYNTDGVYPIELLYRKAAAGIQGGTLCPTIFPELANDDAPGGFGVMTGFGAYPNYTTHFPAGISFAATDEELSRMSVRIQGNPGSGEIGVNGVTVTGYLVLESGSATGGGWFIPEAGNSSGLINGGQKATFGFNAKQKDGLSSGALTFTYHGDGLVLESTGFDWVTVATGQAMFEGTGTINSAGSYKFRVRAVDGVTDRFEIRIWTGSANFDSPTYRAEGDLGGGQIVVHKK